MQSTNSILSCKVNLGDARLDKRFQYIVDRISQYPHNSIPSCFSKPSELKATYRFFSSKQFDSTDITDGIIQDTFSRITDEHLVFMIQDTTDLDYSSHRSTKGLGYLERSYMLGIKQHSCLAISEQGIPMGLTYIKTWVRDIKDLGKKAKRKKTPLSDKESARWKECIDSVSGQMRSGQHFIHIADREADIYDVLSCPRKEGEDILIRAAQNRSIAEKEKLFQHVLTAPVAGLMDVAVERKKGQSARVAKLEIRFERIEIQPPNSRKHEHLPPCTITVICAREKDNPTVQQPILWYLLTTLPVETAEQAKQCVRWYSLRWLIERFHYILKEGCMVEELQLEEGYRLKNALAVYIAVAWRLMHLTYVFRKNPNANALEFFSKDEINALLTFTTKQPVNQHPKISIKEVLLMIAKIGGFIGRKSDGDPGAKVLWQGISQLKLITETYSIFTQNVGNE